MAAKTDTQYTDIDKHNFIPSMPGNAGKGEGYGEDGLVEQRVIGQGRRAVPLPREHDGGGQPRGCGHGQGDA